MCYRIAAVLTAFAAVMGCAALSSRPCKAEQLKPQTVQAFESYIRSKEAISDKELREGKAFLQIDALPEPERSQAYTGLRGGQIIIHGEERQCGSTACAGIPGGLIHDWTGIVFVPGISLPQALAALQDYDRDSAYYGPEVVQSKLLARSGDEFRVFLRLKRVQVITAVFDTEYDVRYANQDAIHAYARSYSTRIARIPSRMNSDHLTLLGFVAMFLAGVSYASARWNPIGLLLATACLALNWFGDSLDGTLARVRNCQRPRYGFYVDHMIDSFGAIFLMAGLGFSRYVDWRIAACMLIVFLLLSIETYLASYTLGVFRLSFGKLGPTEIRLLLALGNIVLWLHPDATVPRLGFRLFDFGGIVAAGAMAVMAIVAAICHMAELYRQETR